MLLDNSDFHNNSEDITYDNWKSHILKTLENCTINELEEYLMFLNQEYRNCENKCGSLQSLLIPFVIAMLGFIFSTYIDNLLHSGILAVMLLLLIFSLLILVFWKLSVKQEKYKNFQYFYQDMKEIVDERINLIKTNGTEE